MGHALKTQRMADFMQNKLADYIIRYSDPVSEVAGEYCLGVVDDKVWMYKEIMTNNDNLESSLLTSNLLNI